MQKNTLRLSILLASALLFAAFLAACGGGSSNSVSSDDVAVVDGTQITKQQFAQLLAQAKLSYKQNGRAFPKQGTTEYEAVKAQVIDLLVQAEEREQKAKSLGIVVTDKQITNRLNQIKKQYFGGSQKKYVAGLKQQHVTEQQVRTSIRQQLVATALENRVVKGVTVSDGEIHDYYLQHSQDYAQPQSRDVRYILVKSKPLAQSLYSQLKSAPDKTWCTLAKKYSQDPGSKQTCGKGSFSKGQTVAEFDKVLFSAPTNQVHAPIHNSQYGWFVIEPTSVVHPRQVTPEKKVSSTIKQTLLSSKKQTAVSDWMNDLIKSYCKGKVSYGVGYTPNPDPCTPASTTTGATTTG
jgi:parvulin-like peptidyl-prolyl isomerase